MYRRVIAIILAVLIFACSLPCSSFAAEGTADTKGISVVWMGTSFSKTVLEKDGGIYAPISWLTYFGLLMCKESDTEYEYYYADQEEPGSFAKRIFIEKEDLSFSICYYLPQYNLGLEMGTYNTWIADSLEALDASDAQEFIDKLLGAWNKKEAAIEYSQTRANYVSIYDGSFSDYLDHDGEKYLPIAELLPLINAKITIGDDGALHIEPNLTTLSQALYNADIGSLCFNAEDDIKGDKFVSAGGLVVDSLTSFRFDRLDFIWNSGRVADYEEIFKAYLTEDETYLSAYDKEVTPQEQALELGKDLFKNANTAFKYLKAEKKLFDIYNWDTDEYPEFSFLKDIDEDIKINGADMVKGAYKAFDYWRAYYHQVDDHREMLNAVYSYDKNDVKQNTPSYRAAITTYSLYSEKYADRLLSATSKSLQDYITKELPKKAIKDAVQLYSLTVDITKLILPEEYKVIHTDSLIYVMDAATEKSYNVFLERKYSGQYDADSLNDLRLCAIMSLISSKYAYKSIWDENYEKVGKINELLEKLYLAADGVECDSSDYYNKKKSELEKNLKELKTEEGWIEKKLSMPFTNYLGMTVDEIAAIWGEDYEVTKDEFDRSIMYYENNRSQCQFVFAENVPSQSIYEIYVRRSDNIVPIVGDLTNQETYNSIKELYPTADFIGDFMFPKIGTAIDLIVDGFFVHYGWIQSNAGTDVADYITIMKYIPEIQTSQMNDAQYEPESNFKYSEPTILKYNGTNKHVVIPPTIGGKPVTKITLYYTSESTYGAFYKNQYIESVVIPSGVTSVGYCTFDGCSNLKEVILPETLNELGRHAFRNCTSLSQITLPKGIIEIPSDAFAGCSALTSITIPEGTKHIKLGAFSNCKNLKSISLPKTISYLESGIFSGCDNLTDIYYSGTEEEFRNITISGGERYNQKLYSANIHFNS